MTIEDDIAFLQRIPILRPLGATALRILAIGAESSYLEPGQVLFKAGDTADGGYIVQRGSFRLDPEKVGEPELIAGPGTLLGEFGLVHGDAASRYRDVTRSFNGAPHFAGDVRQDARRLPRCGGAFTRSHRRTRR